MAGNTSVPEAADRFAINVIENNSNEILLLKRYMDTRIGAGLWGLSSGHIEPGESPEQCSLREIDEELGTDCTLDKIAGIGPVRDTYYGGIYEIYLFHYKWQAGPVKLNHEHTDYAWVSREKFRDYRVVDGVDEDIFYFGIWPERFLNPGKLPKRGS